MKLAFILFVFLSSLIPTWMNIQETEIDEQAIQKKTEFENTARNAYNYYTIVKKEENENYVFEVIVGKYNNGLYYDIFLYNISSSYVPRIEIDDVEYSIEKLTNGDYIYYSTNSITNPQNSKIAVYMFDGISRVNYVSIPSSYDDLDSKQGVGNGVIVSFPDPIETVSKDFVTILSISICIIFICLTGIGIFYIMKIGKKSATPMGYQKNLPNIDMSNARTIYDAYKKNDDIEIDVVVDDEIKSLDIDIKQPKVEAKQEGQTSVYDKSPKYSEEVEAEIPEANIGELLMMKGYKTDYSMMTEAEKNDVMVYLMVLRKTEQISYDQYSKEVIKLWKK